MGLSAAQQAFALRGRFPDSICRLKAGRLVWLGSLRPTALSRDYSIEISYGPRSYPRVRVLDELATRDGQPLPHLYSNGTLCLHEDDGWTPLMSIADSTVPWTSEWLANYELWLPTGKWYGGGVWPPRRSPFDDPAEEPLPPLREVGVSQYR